MQLCVFSKRLQSLDFTALGRELRAIGVGAVDLTVRPGGHIAPEEARDRLPEAAERLRAEGVAIAMISTGITSCDFPHARETLEAAARLGVRHAKLGYFEYRGFGTMRQSLAEAGAALRDLAALAAEAGIFLGCHNHSGPYVGAHVAHLVRLVEPLDPERVGLYFDPAHAVAEGPRFGWMEALDDASDRVRMLALKDFAIGADGRIDLVPMGRGIVPWAKVVECLRRIAGRIGPVSVHAEKELPAAEALRFAAADKAFFGGLWGG